MEPHYGKPVNYDEFTSACREPLEEFFQISLDYAEEHHGETLEFFRSVDLEDLTVHYFWSEYVWTVYTAGFSAKIITKKFETLMNAYGPWDFSSAWVLIWSRVRPVFGNERKCKSIVKCRMILKELGWADFREAYCTEVDNFAELPGIGHITKFHLARNLGIDCVKPDIHLVRLAHYFGFSSPLLMCSYLEGLSGERIGVVDFILWAWSAAFGTKDIENVVQVSEVQSSTAS